MMTTTATRTAMMFFFFISLYLFRFLLFLECDAAGVLPAHVGGEFVR